MSIVQPETTQFREALQASEIQSLPAEARQNFHEGIRSLQMGEAATAVAAFSRSLEQTPEFVPAHIFIGIAHALTSDIYPALDHLEIATRLEQDNFAAQYTLAQLNFKLRVPKKGYEAAELARRCVHTVEQRKMLTDLLKEERARERNGITRPTLDKPFSTPTLIVAGCGFIASLIAIAAYMH